jgi:hypothetical protein
MNATSKLSPQAQVSVPARCGASSALGPARFCRGRRTASGSWFGVSGCTARRYPPQALQEGAQAEVRCAAQAGDPRPHEETPCGRLTRTCSCGCWRGTTRSKPRWRKRSSKRGVVSHLVLRRRCGCGIGVRLKPKEIARRSRCCSTIASWRWRTEVAHAALVHFRRKPGSASPIAWCSSRRAASGTFRWEPSTDHLGRSRGAAAR